ncbi:MAG: gamma carbonic anhydrase family protein [Litoreibacter sp.]|nr:gamma carbonic anhydrase family protein [Litoreibacter sp.]
MTLYALGDRKPVVPESGDYWVAPDANVIGKVVLEEGASIWFGCTLRGDNEVIHIGRGSNLQENCVVHTDMGYPLYVGAQCTIGHKAMLHGCTIGDGSLVGMGAMVMNGAVIGKGCLIGAGALVTEGKEIPDGSMVLGAPGKVVKTLSPEMQQGMLTAADHYVENFRRFKAGLSELK